MYAGRSWNSAALISAIFSRDLGLLFSITVLNAVHWHCTRPETIATAAGSCVGSHVYGSLESPRLVAGSGRHQRVHPPSSGAAVVLLAPTGVRPSGRISKTPRTAD